MVTNVLQGEGHCYVHLDSTANGVEQQIEIAYLIYLFDVSALSLSLSS
jgi:hypothetical protein